MIATTLIERVQLARFKTLQMTGCSLQIWLSLVTLALGVFGYVVHRAASFSVPTESIPLFQPMVGFLAMLGRSLLPLVHVFVFSVRSAVFLGNGRYAALAFSATWFLLTSVFELAEQAVITLPLMGFVPSWLQEMPVLDRIAGYFRHGTFDLIDIVFITAGALAACLVIGYVRLRRTSHG
jgi:hypothetical protein